MASVKSTPENPAISATDQRNVEADETSPLLLTQTESQGTVAVETIGPPLEPEIKPVSRDAALQGKVWPRSTRWLILLCAFVTSLSFGVTQAPILYVFRIMTCDAYYQDHPPSSVLDFTASGIASNSSVLADSQPVKYDRCAIRAIESSAALSISLVGGLTTVFGLLNLFVTGSLIKRIGLKPTLLLQIFFPAVRLFVQNIAIDIGGRVGIMVFQSSQVVSALGGPSGYILVLNSYITEVVEYEGRTAALGILQGNMLFGSALGFLSGGLVSDAFGIKAPFRVTCVLFLSSCAYAATFLPSIPPATSDKADSLSKSSKNGFARFFGPLAAFLPRKFIGRDGIVRVEYGSFLLACGVFLGINATGYLPTLLQLYSTDKFGFTPKENGFLISLYSLLRGLFLTIAFPRIIAFGRQWTVDREDRHRNAGDNPNEQRPLLDAHEEGSDARNTETKKQEQIFTFDLVYTKFSLIADGLLTGLCSLVREGSEMYLVATVLPFAAGTGSAAKGTVLQMVGSSATSNERTDALAGISLVENIARLSTTFLFGAIFAGLVSIGRLELVFVCNASFAFIGFGILLFARFPREGSQRLDKIRQEVDYPTE